MKTHKPGFPCKSLRITPKVTQRDDQYAHAAARPAVSLPRVQRFTSDFTFVGKQSDLHKVLAEEEGEHFSPKLGGRTLRGARTPPNVMNHD